MTQLERIAHMEAILDRAVGAAAALSHALEDYLSLQKEMDELFSYYSSAQWRQDYEDDCNGKLPADLKRGVLSEDAVYNLLLEIKDLRSAFRSL